MLFRLAVIRTGPPDIWPLGPSLKSSGVVSHLKLKMKEINSVPSSLLNSWVSRNETIVAEVAQEYGVSIAQLKGPQQQQCLVKPRHESWLRLYQTGLINISQIGRMFNRDHSTVHYGIKRAEERRRQGTQ